MKNINLYIFIVLIILLTCCRKTSKAGAVVNEPKPISKAYTDSAIIYELINISLSIEDLQKYFAHQKIMGQEFIAVEQTNLPYLFEDFTNNNTIIFPVKFLAAEQISYNDIKAYIKINNIVIKGDSVHAVFLYDVEGVNLEVYCHIDTGILKLRNYHLWER